MQDPVVALPASSVILADDHATVRRGVRTLLEGTGEFEVLAEVADVHDARRKVRDLAPDVLVLDLAMPGGSSLEAIPVMRGESPATQIVIFTMHAEEAFAREALRKGAVGYVIKDADEDELIEAMRRAVAGQQYVKVAPHVCNEVRPARSKGPLSSRESEVVRLIASGHTNAETASELCLSIRTVEAHRARIHQKLRLSSRAALFEYAVQSGLLEIG